MQKFSENTSAEKDIRRWLSTFAAAVRGRDFDAGRALFAADVVSFGTRASAVIGIEPLVAQQWLPIWNATRGFDFDPAVEIRVTAASAWVATRWRSQGINEGGRWFDRAGRATLVLHRGDDGRWRAVHSHFSVDPNGAAMRPVA